MGWAARQNPKSEEAQKIAFKKLQKESEVTHPKVQVGPEKPKE